MVGASILKGLKQQNDDIRLVFFFFRSKIYLLRRWDGPGDFQVKTMAMNPWVREGK